MPTGRPSKLTPEVQERICVAVRSGNYYAAACGYAQVSYQSFREWMKKGARAKTGKYREFLEAVRRAQADSEVGIVANWKAAIPADWRAARDFLARRFPRRWGPKETRNVNYDEEIHKFLAILAGQREEETPGEAPPPCGEPGGGGAQPGPGPPAAGPGAADGGGGLPPGPVAGDDAPLFG